MTDQFGGSTYSYSGTSRTQTDQMQQGLQSFGNALGNLARMKQYEERLENRFRKCMNITMGYDLRRVPIMRTKFYKEDKCSGPIAECEKLNPLNKNSKEKSAWTSDIVFGDDLHDASDAYERNDYEKAFNLLSPLAEQGVARAQNALGTMYLTGEGIPQDSKEAVKWYRLSAEQGFALGQNNLGLMYDNGHGVPEDSKEAVKWYRLAAEQGFAKAQFAMGAMYFEGQGVSKDYVLAHMWWNLSTSNGHKSAIHNRNIVEKKMSKQQIEKAQRLARNWKPKK